MPIQKLQNLLTTGVKKPHSKLKKSTKVACYFNSVTRGA